MDENSFWWHVAVEAVGAVIGGSIFTFLFFLIKEKLFSMPDIAGRWYFELRTESSAFNNFKCMVLQYEALIWRDGNRISGTTEKIYEDSATGKRSFTGANRSRGVLDGFYEQRHFSRTDRVTLHLVEKGQIRTGTYFFDLQMPKSVEPNGEFVSTIADQFGSSRWQRKPFQN
jgi:hypothetical protein